jgi:hypothetical protein
MSCAILVMFWFFFVLADLIVEKAHMVMASSIAAVSFLDASKL